MSRIATDPRRIGFVSLRTVGSSPVAPHPALLLLAWPTQLPSTTKLRHPPARTCTVPTGQLHGRTHGRARPGQPRTIDGGWMAGSRPAMTWRRAPDQPRVAA